MCAASGGRDHPVFALWPVSLAPALRTAMIEKEIRKVDVFTARYRVARAEWSIEPFDPFFNANRPEDWAQHLQGIDAVVNCAGVLQDSPRESTQGVHVDGLAGVNDVSSNYCNLQPV